ncbi:alpha/beta fold hydrolase [Bacillus sp. S/N-304-OC-R1]|uniref:alpha/beta fold hydrolase n=1 Tax=Bacillus sp. S/N-304-OC-R1 TaxID=2758034 RepID=UPI001C8DA977|nr:alpha/beta fold hydrolase [Bacillus sp. S/N-304-OC-R1]MBY0121525.1 alpha/beta fold hydrolase [Bacillus sp. S/N-304-OC-R1]
MDLVYWEKNFIQTSRGGFEFFTQGSGEPLCITHLYSEFNELGYYFADAFTKHFKVYLINLKGAGNSLSVTYDDELSMSESVKDLEAIKEALSYKQWSFAGHSTGGMLGLVYALMYPQSLAKLLIGGAASSKRYMEYEGSIYCPKSPLNKKLKEIFSILKSPTTTKEEKREASREWTNMSLYRPERWDEYFSKPSSGKVVQKRLDYYSFKDLPNYDIQSELPNVTIPTIVFCGKHDAQCPLIFSEEINEGLENSILYIFEESNHLPFLEEKNKFEEMVSEFQSLTLKSINSFSLR